ncbi:PREDICTED: glucosylceramidase-like isoform X2 [Habropoda laboriosa]|uniref:glucosylceramidase-like isoform X2 n=1 Tax=Habropoda laboriosa TaxID=597456 RepID=UPI00083D24DA|nr:PREDICTED: glucosylceramidase-like isoform X2 [Habropoda laboriosa]
MNMGHMWKTIFAIAFFFGKGIANECEPYRVDDVVIACVCNSTYCDGPSDDEPKVPKEGSSFWYVTNKNGLRMHKSEVNFGSCDGSPADATITVDSSKQYQTILGFGGGFTDSFGIDLSKLSPAAQEQLIRAYYDPKKGSGYTLGRIPCASTDFSTRFYTYDDVVNDTSLKHFALAEDDYKYKMPYARKALELNKETLFFSAAWTPPAWMKTNNKISGKGYLKKEHYQTYANYLVKFMDEYKKHGIDMWAISTGNEPLNAFAFNLPLISMGWTPKMMADWIANYLGPTLSSSAHNKTMVLAFDDNRHVLPWFVEPTLENRASSKYVVGTAVHWYQDFLAPAYLLDRTHNEFPDKIIIMTEASINPVWNTSKVKDESWSRGEKYILSIIEYMNHWAVGWVDWNLALDVSGGPTWQKDYLDSAIVINADEDVFYKQPMYYAIHHISRFVGRGSARISVTGDTSAVESTAFLTPSGEVVVVLYNKDTVPKHVILNDLQNGPLCFELSPLSMNTLKYK